MISRERLAELIKQGATIYEVKYGNINPVSLKNKIRYVNYKYETITFEPRPDEKYLHHKYFKRLFETKEEAEFAKEFKNIKHIETLDLPLFNELPEEFRISLTRFRKEFNCLLVCELYIKSNDICILYNIEGASNCVFHKPLTKENYWDACEIIKLTFLGDDIDDLDRELTKEYIKSPEHKKRFLREVFLGGNIDD